MLFVSMLTATRLPSMYMRTPLALAEPSQVAPVGGVFQAGEAVMEPFLTTLHEESALACIVTPRFPPVVGSLLLALRSLDISSTPQVFRQIEDTLSPFGEAIQ